ncbi:hypothetical protein C1645_865551 [Glomus cerebriforme]|uniref:Uncharacterized protein n=1 Tax=Glomus cerebriforme TaxID=658196 RepID=A0A397S3U0_9GLOM|nr:hypothetical protein C1645_865551 [Glomus cerebriforme]
MWERIEVELNNINVENLGFDHPICSGVLNVKSEPFINISGSFCDIFKEPFQKYKLEQNHDILDTCEEFIQNEESKINEDEGLRDVEFGKWLDSSEKLQEKTRQILESLLKVWKSPKYEAYTKKGKLINEGSYICEVLAPLINIVMSDLPRNPAVWDIWGEEGSSASTIRKESRKFAQKPDYMTIVQLEKDVELKIVYLETGDVIELYTMRKESSIYKYCLIEEATIPLHMTSPSAIYPLIHVLMILRTAVACTIHKILYSSDSEDSEHSSSEMVVTVMTPKNL